MVVGGIAVAGEGVDAVHVVDVAVEIVVDPVARDLAGVGPEVARQILVGQAHAGVDDGDDHPARVGAQVPGLRGVDVGVRHAGRSAVENAEVVQAPERVVVVAKIVRNGERANDVVGLGILDQAAGLEALDGLQRRVPGSQIQNHQIIQSGAGAMDPRAARERAEPGGAVRMELHEDAVAPERGRILRRASGDGQKQSAENDAKPARKARARAASRDFYHGCMRTESFHGRFFGGRTDA